MSVSEQELKEKLDALAARRQLLADDLERLYEQSQQKARHAIDLMYHRVPPNDPSTGQPLSAEERAKLKVIRVENGNAEMLDVAAYDEQISHHQAQLRELYDEMHGVQQQLQASTAAASTAAASTSISSEIEKLRQAIKERENHLEFKSDMAHTSMNGALITLWEKEVQQMRAQLKDMEAYQQQQAAAPQQQQAAAPQQQQAAAPQQQQAAAPPPPKPKAPPIGGISYLAGGVDNDAIAAKAKAAGAVPAKTIFVFPGNTGHHDATGHANGGLKGVKGGAGLAKASAGWGAAGYPTLSIPTTSMATHSSADSAKSDKYAKAAMQDLYKAVGAGYHLVLPVRPKGGRVPVTNSSGQALNVNGGVYDPKAKPHVNKKLKEPAEYYFSKEGDGKEASEGLTGDPNHEPSFWGGVEAAPNHGLAQHYLGELNKLQDFILEVQKQQALQAIVDGGDATAQQALDEANAKVAAFQKDNPDLWQAYQEGVANSHLPDPLAPAAPQQQQQAAASEEAAKEKAAKEKAEQQQASEVSEEQAAQQKITQQQMQAIFAKLAADPAIEGFEDSISKPEAFAPADAKPGPEGEKPKYESKDGTQECHFKVKTEGGASLPMSMKLKADGSGSITIKPSDWPKKDPNMDANAKAAADAKAKDMLKGMFKTMVGTNGWRKNHIATKPPEPNGVPIEYQHLAIEAFREVCNEQGVSATLDINGQRAVSPEAPIQQAGGATITGSTEAPEPEVTPEPEVAADSELEQNAVQVYEQTLEAEMLAGIKEAKLGYQQLAQLPAVIEKAKQTAMTTAKAALAKAGGDTAMFEVAINPLVHKKVADKIAADDQAPIMLKAAATVLETMDEAEAKYRQVLEAEILKGVGELGYADQDKISEIIGKAKAAAMTAANEVFKSKDLEPIGLNAAQAEKAQLAVKAKINSSTAGVMVKSAAHQLRSSAATKALAAFKQTMINEVTKELEDIVSKLPDFAGGHSVENVSLPEEVIEEAQRNAVDSAILSYLEELGVESLDELTIEQQQELSSVLSLDGPEVLQKGLAESDNYVVSAVAEDLELDLDSMAELIEEHLSSRIEAPAKYQQILLEEIQKGVSELSYSDQDKLEQVVEDAKAKAMAVAELSPAQAEKAQLAVKAKINGSTAGVMVKSAAHQLRSSAATKALAAFKQTMINEVAEGLQDIVDRAKEMGLGEVDMISAPDEIFTGAQQDAIDFAVASYLEEVGVDSLDKLTSEQMQELTSVISLDGPEAVHKGLVESSNPIVQAAADGIELDDMAVSIEEQISSKAKQQAEVTVEAAPATPTAQQQH